MKVSVVVLTYNHEKYIAQALDGILMQQADFPYEVIVTEDCSTDRTREIVLEYQRNHPEKIRVLLSPQNLNDKVVITRAFEAARGEFIASMDGDDFWTSPHKLQKQVEFLERYPECPLCFHDARILHEDGSYEPEPFVLPGRGIFSSADDLFKGSFIPSCSPMYRRGALLPLPDWFFVVPSIDWALYLAAGAHGEIGYLDEVMGVYRVHSGGAWSGKSEIERMEGIIRRLTVLDEVTQGAYHEQAQWALSRSYLALAVETANAMDFPATRRYARAALRRNPLASRIDRSALIRCLLAPYSSYAIRAWLRVKQIGLTPLPKR